MTGAEHYEKAENLLNEAEPLEPAHSAAAELLRSGGLLPLGVEEREEMIARAHAHATLALAAAIAGKWL